MIGLLNPRAAPKCPVENAMWNETALERSLENAVTRTFQLIAFENWLIRNCSVPRPVEHESTQSI